MTQKEERIAEIKEKAKRVFATAEANLPCVRTSMCELRIRLLLLAWQSQAAQTSLTFACGLLIRCANGYSAASCGGEYLFCHSAQAQRSRGIYRKNRN
jgi:hypothetical protein